MEYPCARNDITEESPLQWHCYWCLRLEMAFEMNKQEDYLDDVGYWLYEVCIFRLIQDMGAVQGRRGTATMPVAGRCCSFIFYCQCVRPCAHAKLWVHLVLLMILQISRATDVYNNLLFY